MVAVRARVTVRAMVAVGEVADCGRHVADFACHAYGVCGDEGDMTDCDWQGGCGGHGGREGHGDGVRETWQTVQSHVGE